MRQLRLALLLGVALILAAVARDYFAARRAGLSVRLAEPSQMPSHLDAQATRWTWSQSTGDRRSVEGSAARVRQTKDTGVLELDEVELRIFHEGAQSFDLVETRNALFYSRDGRLYSESPVVLTLGLATTAAGGSGTASPTIIRSTRVTFDSKQGTSSTDQPTEYEFNGGRGRSVGALYDSTEGQLLMRSDVYLERFPERAGDPLVKVWAAQLTYHERAGRVELKGGVTLERGPQKLQSAEALVFLEEGLVRRIEAHEAHGVDRQPGRTVTFRAPWLEALYADGLLERASGANPAEIESVTESSVIQANGERIDLHYVPEPGAQASRLREMYSRDKARIELRPAAGGAGPGDLRRVSADLIHLVMREDGKEVERIETLTPGKLEILPRNASGPRRILTADRMTAHYTSGSRMEKLRASGHAAVENHPPAKRGSLEEQEPLRSWSEELEAQFAPDSGELEWMNQWTNFRFERGRRRGQSQQARFVPAKNELTLETAARVWDAESNISARRILQNDRTGDLLAEGDVTSRYQPEESRQPESKPAQQPGSLFTASQPVFAVADHMVSREEKGEVEYRGGARLWQGEDRIEADRITILRQAGNLSAEGGVKSYLRARDDRQEPGAKQKDAGSRMLVQADSLRYEEASRQASYRGETSLRRGALLIRSDELDAWFTASQNGGAQGGGSQTLKEAVARGNVRISEPGAGGGVRNGYGREAVYDPAAAVARLQGAPARVVDEAGNETRGPELTYRLNDDRLLVQGKEDDRAYSLRRRNQP